MRERRRISDKPSGSANTETRRWVYYDDMQFLIPHVTPRPTFSNVPTPPDEDTCHETEDTPQNSSTSVAIETLDNVSPQEALSNIETCEDRSTVKPILPMSKKTGVTKKRNRDTADEMDMCFLEELKQLKEQASSQNDPDRQFLLSLLPMMKQLSARDNIDIKIEIYEIFRRKMFKPAPSVQYGYWTDQNQSHTPSACTSDIKTELSPNKTYVNFEVVDENNIEDENDSINAPEQDMQEVAATSCGSGKISLNNNQAVFMRPGVPDGMRKIEHDPASVPDSYGYTERDEYTIFGEYIASRLRKISDMRIKLQLQNQINNMLFETEMRLFTANHQ
ncbi:uncharacterized protein [Palaemon carinicauda]